MDHSKIERNILFAYIKRLAAAAIWLVIMRTFSRPATDSHVARSSDNSANSSNTHWQEREGPLMFLCGFGDNFLATLRLHFLRAMLM